MSKGGTNFGANAAEQPETMVDGFPPPSCEELAAANKQLRARVESLQQELYASEERFGAMLEIVPAFMFVADPQFDMEYVSNRYCQYTGADADQILGAGWAKYIHPKDLEEISPKIRHSIETGETLEVESRIRHADGSYRWFLTRADAQRDGAGQVKRWFGSTFDVNEQRNIADRRRVQLTEQQHRVRNILAIVRSVFARTVEGHGGVNGAADHFRGRLDALARTHGVLLRTVEGCIELEEMIWNELISHGAPQSGPVQVDGPSVRLRGKAAESLGLTLHELATNAAKYGALSVDNGSIRVHWWIQEAGSGARLQLVWEEGGVQSIHPAPSHLGFGRELIEEGLPYELGAQTKLDFASGGVRCTIGLPVGADVLVADCVASSSEAVP